MKSLDQQANDLSPIDEAADLTMNRVDAPKLESPARSSYQQILSSSSITGGAQITTMMIGLVRNKLVAIMIGPTGIGLIAIYQSITNLVSVIAGLGIQTSGVRDVARCHGFQDWEGVAKAISVLRRVCWFTGTIGMLLMILLAPWISQISFGNQDHAWAIALLGLTILFGNIAGGQSAYIRGTRRIGDLARINIWGAIVGSFIALGFYGWLGLQGVVPATIALSLSGLVISTYFARRIVLPPVQTSWDETWKQSIGLMRFGVAIMVNGVLVAGVAYITKMMVLGNFGLEGAGLYVAAFSLSGMFAQFILAAMGADFYPRLTAEANNHPRMTQLINEQTEIGLLLAFPGLLATLVFAPLVISLFYTSHFAAAADLLKWFVLGCIGRVISWPMGFSILAKGQARLFIIVELITNAFHLGLIWIGLNTLGLHGVAIAFAVLYFLHVFGMLLFNRFTIGFVWSRGVWFELAWMIPTAIMTFTVLHFVDMNLALIVGSLICVASTVVCIRSLARRLDPQHKINRWIARFAFWATPST
ncbi:MAG TPA: O-antigen translocase [Pirellulaceae bacterium]|nr:O-antigen translocase [Pirellulaceae bacterium]HMO93444.1 O-antigen translocase [Pirellulaceae bacterium]HMP68448.1 O-antigen translocase [Pirellulaceae bacterium]